MAEERPLRGNAERRGKSVDGAVALSDLTPDPRNVRTHSARNLTLIESARREVGAARSIVVDEDGTILAGNATVATAAQVGLTHVRVVEAAGTELVAVRRSNLTPEQKRRLALLDNRAAELAGWDTEVLAALAEDTDLSGLWEPDELADLLADAAPAPVELLGDPDDVPPVPDEPITRLGDLRVLDPFGGSGSTLVAREQLGRVGPWWTRSTLLRRGGAALGAIDGAAGGARHG